MFSQSLSIVLRCGGQLLNVIFSFLSARCILGPGFVLIRVSCRCVIAGLFMLYKVISNSDHCLFNELPPLLLEFDILRCGRSSSIAVRSIKVLRCRMSQFARCFLPAQVRMWNDLPCTVFDTGTLDGFRGAVNRWLLPYVVFSSVFRGAGASGLRKQFINNFFPTRACAAGFNNNNNNYKICLFRY